MKYEILLQTMLAQGGIQAVEAKSQTYIKVIDDLKTFIRLPYET